MQDPEQTIPVPYNYGGQGQGPAQQPPYGQGQFSPQSNGWPSTPQSPYPQSPQMPGQQPMPGSYNPGPGQFSGYQPGPQSPQTPPKKRGLLWASVGVVVLLLLGLGGFFAFTHSQKTSTPNTTAQSSSTHVATAQASSSQSSTGKNASANSGAQSSASSDGNTVQAQATAAVSTVQAQAQSQGNNVPAQSIAPAGPADQVARSFFTAIQNQDYDTAYKYTSFKAFTNDSFHQASTVSDQSLGKLTAYTLGKTTLYPGTNTTNAQVIVSVTRVNVPSHSALAMLTLQNGTWKITDGTVWQ